MRTGSQKQLSDFGKVWLHLPRVGGETDFERHSSSYVICYGAGLKDGIDEDDLVAKELGSSSAKALKGNANWEQYKEPLKARITEVRVNAASGARGFGLGALLCVPGGALAHADQCLLVQRAAQLQKEADESNLLFVAGRRFFEKGEYVAPSFRAPCTVSCTVLTQFLTQLRTSRYADSTMLFKEALDQQKGGASSRLGGDIQLWLGLAYQVTCILGSNQSPSCKHATAVAGKASSCNCSAAVTLLE